MKPTKEDSVSLGLSLICIMLLSYFSTFVGFTDYLLIPTILLLSGLVLQLYMRGKISHDEDMDAGEAKDLLKYTLIGLVGIGIGSLVSHGLFKPPQPLALAVYDQAMYGTLYAVAEERFFRGAFTSFLAWKIHTSFLVALLSGLIFSVYHLGVYQSSPEAMTYVMFAGIILTYTVLKSGRLSPSILAHITNNLMAV